MDKTVPPGGVHGALIPPCSKSYAQRAIAASLLAEGISELHNIELCDDIRSALRCIETLGARVEYVDGNSLRICGGLTSPTQPLKVGESGLASRLFTPIASLGSKPVTIEGEGTLLHRPMGVMLDSLSMLGVRVHDNHGRLPIEVQGPILGGEISVDGSLSSQFITGLLLALPLAQTDTTIRLLNPVSTPYIDMTIDTAERFGVEICHNGYEEFYIRGNQLYHPTSIHIEGDWSAAAMLLVAGATTGEVCVRNITQLSKQADKAICEALERAGAGLVCEADSITASQRPLCCFEFDATECPDLFPALVALAAAADGISTISGTRRLTHKESDRAQSLRTEYAKLGIEIDISQEDVMTIRGGAIHSARTGSHGDHRVAMSLAVAALRADADVIIQGAECVAKSFPDFFEKLDSIRIK